ncbi:MAG TPA: MFS transporter [Planctomycetia bacterium]|nr:MFS transporter [Planctomycetia bacterium]
MTAYGRDFALAFAAQFWFTLAATFWTHYARWIGFLGGNEWDVGIIMGGGTAVALLIRPWLAHSINRFGSRRMWLVGHGFFAAAALANCGLYSLGAGIYLAQPVAVIGLALVYAAGLTYITEISPPERRTAMMGSFGAAGFAGVLVGPYLGELLLGGPARGRGEFMQLFAGLAAMLTVASALVVLMREPKIDRPAEAFNLRRFAASLKAHWPGPIVWVNFAFGFMMAVPFRLLARYIDHEHLSAVGVGGFFLFYAGIGIVIRLRMGDWPERRGLSFTVALALALFAVGMESFTLVSEIRPWLLAVPALICGTAHAIMFHSMVALTIRPFPAERRGTGTVLALMMQDLGSVTGLPLLGFLATRNFHWVFHVSAAFAAAAAVFYSYASARDSTSAREPAVAEEPGAFKLADRASRMGKIPAA